MEYSIIDARREHLPEIEAMERRFFSCPMTGAYLISQLPDDTHELKAAVDDSGRVLGYGGMLCVIDEGEVSNIAVDEGCRRQGIGEAILESLIGAGRHRGLEYVTLEVRESNAPAIALYEKNGFVRVGLRKNYYEKPRENGVLMTYYLNRGAFD